MFVWIDPEVKVIASLEYDLICLYHIVYHSKEVQIV